MDPSWINTLPEPLRTILIGAAGDFVGGLAADMVGRLLGKAGYQVQKRFRPGPQQAALNEAMAEALLLTVRRQTDDPVLQAHYLDLFGQWASRDAVAGELSQVVDPRPDAEIDLDLVAAEFEAAGYDPDLLGDVVFQDVVAQFVANFYDSAARQPALQGQIEIGLLRGIAGRAEEQVRLLRRVADALERPPAPAQPGESTPLASVTINGGDNIVVTGTVAGNIHYGDVYKTVVEARGELSPQQATAILNSYLGWVRRIYDKIQTFGLENPRQVKQPRIESLTDVFIPLTVRRFRPPKRSEQAEALRGKVGMERILASYQLARAEERVGEAVALEDLLTVSDRLAIIGGAGSGKSTILHHLAVTLARAIQQGESFPYRLPAGKPLIPLLVPLRYYRDYLEKCNSAPARALEAPNTGTLAGFIAWQLQRGSKHGSEEFFHRLLGKGGCLLMIDGLDEVVSREQRGQVREQVETLVRADYPGNHVIVTAREAGFQEEAVFGNDFTRLDVQDLTPAQTEQLVGNWCSRLYSEDVAGNQRKLVQAIDEVNERRREKDLAPFVNTPLMVTMVVSVQVGETELPRERAALYEACVKAILQAQYTPEEGRRQVTDWGGPWDAQRDWLCHLAVRMHEGGRAGAALREEQVREVLQNINLAEDKVRAFLIASRHRGGLFEERAEFFQFSHLTFQEYLAARLLAKYRETGRPILQPHVAESWWREVALLTYGYLSMESGELFVSDSPAVQHLRWLSNLKGSAEARLAAAELAGASVLEIEKPDPEQRLQQAKVLVALLEDKTLSTPGSLRAEAGRTLGRLHDPRPGVGLRADGVPDIVWCPVSADEFIMGNTKQTDDMAFGHETPQDRLTLPAFEIGKYPITNAQFDAFVQDGGYTEKQWRGCWTQAGLEWKKDRTGPDKYGGVYDLPNHPVVMVTWYEAIAFCNWLGQKLGRPVSLPSEAQWERAARHTDGRRHPWQGALTPDHANYNQTGIGTTTAVGIFPKGVSQCGALDMSGNVWEWCRTKWRADYTIPSDDDLGGDITRVVRGGSFLDYARHVRCAVRDWYLPHNRNLYVGFRVVVASP